MRRRLLVLSLPVSVVVLVVVVKLWSVVLAGGSAATDFTAGNTDALRDDVAALGFVNVVEPGKFHYAAGTLAVLEHRLDDAEDQFAAALARTEPASSCPVLVNLELVRETLGDRAAAAFDANAAVDRYRSALSVVDEAPAGCFTGSVDADPERRAVLEATPVRLADKIAAAALAPPPPPPPPAALPPPPPPPAAAGPTQTEPDPRLRLNPGGGDPLDRLQQILRDAAAAQNGR